MIEKDCGLRSNIKLLLSLILVNGLAVAGCATLGDIEAANERTQQSLNAFKKESRESQSEIKKDINNLRREIKTLKSTDKKFDKDKDKIIQENQELRASLLNMTATIQSFLNAEKRRYEEGLRWIDNAHKSMGEGIANPSDTGPSQKSISSPRPPSSAAQAAIPAPSTSPSPKSPPAVPSPPPTSPPAPAAIVAAPSPSPTSKTPTADLTPSSSLPSVPPQTPTVPPQSSPQKTPVRVAKAVPGPEEAPIELEESQKPIIDILEILIDPPQVERKSKFKVTVKYDLKAGPDTPKLKYLEQIELFKGALSIQNLKETVERTPGTIFYSQSIEVPEDAPTGVYTIKGVVSSGSVRSSKIKTFLLK